MKTLTNIKPLSNFRVECMFSNGVKKVADLKPLLEKEAFRPIADPHVFASAITNKGYFIEWKDFDIDLSAETLWHISTKVALDET